MLDPLGKLALGMRKLFDYVINIVFAIMLLFLIIGVIIGTGQLFILLVELFHNAEITKNYVHVISQVLSLFVIIELSRSLIDYFHVNRLRLTFIIDAAIVFVLRDVMIGLFENKYPINRIYAISVLLLVLGIIRLTSVLVYQREMKLQQLE